MTKTESPSRKVIPIVPVAGAAGKGASGTGSEELFSLYQSEKKIYPRSVAGLFSRWRWAMVFITQLVFYGIPWLQWGQRQAVLLAGAPATGTIGMTFLEGDSFLFTVTRY